MMFTYLIALIVSIGGLAVIDRRFKLAFWHNRRQAFLTIGGAVGIFIVWDILGIALGIFFHGASAFSLPFTIAPEFPVEEVFFLILLCYSALLLYRGAHVWLSRTSS